MLIKLLLAIFALSLALTLASPVEDQPAQNQQGGIPVPSADVSLQTKEESAAAATDDLKTDASFWGWGGYGGWGGNGGWGGYYRPRYYGYYRPRYYNPYYGYGGYGGGWGGYWG